MMIHSQFGAATVGKINIVAAKNQARLEIVYHIHLIENTSFPEDLFCETKASNAFECGQIKGVAYTLLKVQFFIVVVSFGRG